MASKLHRGTAAEYLAASDWLFAGYEVSMPLTRRAPWDFSVKVGHTIYLVEVKLAYSNTSNPRTHPNTMQVDLRVRNSTFKTRRILHESVDLVHVVAPDQHRTYLIPAEEIGEKSAVSIGTHFNVTFQRGRYTFRRTLNRLLA